MWNEVELDGVIGSLHRTIDCRRTISVKSIFVADFDLLATSGSILNNSTDDTFKSWEPFLLL